MTANMTAITDAFWAKNSNCSEADLQLFVDAFAQCDGMPLDIALDAWAYFHGLRADIYDEYQSRIDDREDEVDAVFNEVVRLPDFMRQFWRGAAARTEAKQDQVMARAHRAMHRELVTVCKVASHPEYKHLTVTQLIAKV